MIDFAKVLALCGFLLMGGCSLEPRYKRPDIVIPAAYKETGVWQAAVPADHIPRGEWWRHFGDPGLNELEARIDTGNQDLAAAFAKYVIYKAYATQANAQVFPTLSAFASPTRNRQSDNRPLRGSNQPDDYNAYTLGIGASYEVDLWGRVSSLVNAGKALEQASAADLESARLSLHSELAKTYFQLRGLDEQIQLLEVTAEDYRRQKDMIEQRHQEGIVSGLDVSRTETLLDEVLAQKANGLARRSLYEHAIATLVGEPASTFAISKAIVKFVQPDIPPGVPSALLQRRPDIAAAERRVAAANAQIGVARAAFFPTLDLGLSAGYQSTMGTALLTAPNSFWSFGPAAFLTIFDSGRREAGVVQAQAATDEVAAHYRAIVLHAFAEVEDNLSLLRRQHEELDSQSAAASAAEHTYNLALNRYREGVVSYLEVVDADAARLRTQSALLDVTTRGLLACVGLIS